jgi:hypothetical protein
MIQSGEGARSKALYRQAYCRSAFAVREYRNVKGRSLLSRSYVCQSLTMFIDVSVLVACFVLFTIGCGLLAAAEG